MLNCRCELWAMYAHGLSLSGSPGDVEGVLTVKVLFRMGQLIINR